MNFSNTIIAWYKKNKRNLPWRNTKDPYKIWLSEIILQQTRVTQGYDYYIKFIANYPTVNDLANAVEDDVLKIWQGLGYYSRARNLHTSAKMVMSHFKGEFPKKYEEAIQLKGVGDYTAAAISSFANNQPHAVVDGNVYRVLARVFGIDTPINSNTGKKDFKELATELLDKKNAGIHNQAIMEFGALQCKPQNPDCQNCPFEYNCIANEKGLQKELPKKIGKTKVRNRYFNYLYITHGKHTYINQRTEKDIWVKLYEFPLIETEFETELIDLMKLPAWHTLFSKTEITVVNNRKYPVHKLSHQHIYSNFITVDIITSKKVNYKKIKQTEISTFAVPRLIELFLQQAN